MPPRPATSPALILSLALAAGCWTAPAPGAPAAPAAPAAPVSGAADPDARGSRPQLVVLRSLAGIDVVETINEAMHIHGGQPADIERVRVNLVVRDARPHTVSAAQIELLSGHCRQTTWTSRTPLVPAGYEAYSWDDARPFATETAQISLPPVPDLYGVAIRLATPASAYQACDRFAFAIRLLIDGATVDLELPLSVVREDPYP